jgi:hypothetical protein
LLLVGCGADRFQDRGKVLKYPVIGKAEHLIASHHQEGFPLSVMLPLCLVDATVDLDHQAAFGSAEIDDKRPDGMLTAELEARKSSVA